jgi:hypothetical protein
MKISTESDQRAVAMRRRAADWAGGEAGAKAFDRDRAAALTVDERLAEGVELMRMVDRLQASIRSPRTT